MSSGHKRYCGLTPLQIERCVVCDRVEQLSPKGRFDKYDLLPFIDLEVAQIHKFFREMCRIGYMKCVYTPRHRFQKGASRGFRMTIAWRHVAEQLESSNRLPGGTCEIVGCGTEAVSYPYRQRYLCRAHLMILGCQWCTRGGTKVCARLRCWEGEALR